MVNKMVKMSEGGKPLSPKLAAMIHAVHKEEKLRQYKDNPPWIVDSGHARCDVLVHNEVRKKHENISDIPPWVSGLKQGFCM